MTFEEISTFFASAKPDQIAELHIRSLLDHALPESQQLEFKAELPTKRNNRANTELRKDVLAMANAEGGRILFGIAENGEGRASTLCGIENADSAIEWMHNVLGSNIDAPLQSVDVRALTIDNESVIIITIAPQASPPSSIQDADKRRFPKRFGRVTRDMTNAEIRSSILDDRVLRELTQIREYLDRIAVAEPARRDKPGDQMMNLLDCTDGQVFINQLVERIMDTPPLRPQLVVAIARKDLAPNQPVRDHEEEVKNIMRTPPGARDGSWFPMFRHPQRYPLGLQGDDNYGECRLQICWNGACVFSSFLDTTGATWSMGPKDSDDTHPLHPLSHIEPLVRLLDLFLHVDRMLKQEGEVIVELSILNAAGVKITNCPPNSYAMRHPDVLPDAIKTISTPTLRAHTNPINFDELTPTYARHLLSELYKEAGFDVSTQAVPYFDDSDALQIN